MAMVVDSVGMHHGLERDWGVSRFVTWPRRLFGENKRHAPQRLRQLWRRSSHGTCADQPLVCWRWHPQIDLDKNLTGYSPRLRCRWERYWCIRHRRSSIGIRDSSFCSASRSAISYLHKLRKLHELHTLANALRGARESQVNPSADKGQVVLPPAASRCYAEKDQKAPALCGDGMGVLRKSYLGISKLSRGRKSERRKGQVAGGGSQRYEPSR
nr:hypothetical protein CFP56_16962 [Quercus suber]